MVRLNTTFRMDESLYDGFQTNLEYSTMVRILSALAVAVALLMNGLLVRSLRAAKRRDVVHGRDVTFRGGPDEMFSELQILIKAGEWSKVRRGLWHTFIFVWILLLPILLTQFGKWKREVCSSKVWIVDTEDDNITDWFKSTSFTLEQSARMGLTFRHNLGIGMSTNATGTNGIQVDGRPEPLTDSVIYSFKQCLYWAGESYDGCEAGQGIREAFDSTVTVVPLRWPRPIWGRRNSSRHGLPYTQEIIYFESLAPWAQSSIKCLTTFERQKSLWVCSFKSDGAWYVADMNTRDPLEGQRFANINTLKLEGINMEDGEWVWYATTLAADIVAGGDEIANFNAARQLAMLYVRFDYLLHGQKQVCKVFQEDSFVVSYIWLGILTITTTLALNMGWSMGRHRDSAHIPMKAFEWYMYFAREQEGGDLHKDPPNRSYYFKKFCLSPGAMPLPEEEDMDAESL